MKNAVYFLVLFFTFINLNAQNWTLKDMGVGLIIEDENYDKQLRITERNNVWDAKELYENGAQAGKYKGNQLFAAWLQGPPANEYLNNYGTPVWLYKYRITYPDGKTFEGGPGGFYMPGFTYFGIKTGGYTEGNWKIEWFIQHRDTKETRSVGIVEFKTTYGKKERAKSDWPLKDIGVGIIDQSEYDKVLKIIKRGDTWSQKELYDGGFFANREKVFAAWIEGPHTNTYLNQNGLPVWSYRIAITYPSGKREEYGNYGFYVPGFATMFINAMGNEYGKWKLEFYVVHWDTQEKKLVGIKEFTLVQ